MTPPTNASRGTGQRGLIAFVLVVVAQSTAVLPVFLLGALATLIRADLGFDERGVGMAVAVFFGVSAIASAPLGLWGQRVGSRIAMRFGVLGSALALAGLAGVAQTWSVLAAFLILAGVANAVIQPATNLFLAVGVESERLGLAFGVKQSSIPLATLLGGMAVPAIGVTIGWRWAYASAAVMAVCLALFIPPEGRRSTDPVPLRDNQSVPRRIFVLLAVAAGGGAAGANAAAAFIVEYAVASGARPGSAGILLSVGSVAAVSARILFGWWADVWKSFPLLRATGTLFVVGATGHTMLAVASSWYTIVVGAILAFGAGWGWSGLFTLAVVRSSSGAAATATGVTQAGVYVGAVVGPLSFGWMVVELSYTWAWGSISVLTYIAGVILLLTERRVVRRTSGGHRLDTGA